jgi:uracil-DNA glycosylase
MVLFVGDEPSAKMKKGARAFDGAACQSRLEDWISKLEPGFHALINSGTERELRIIRGLCRNNPFKVIALGQAASSRLAKLNISHFTLPHPSGRNRLLNNKEYVSMKLSEAKLYLKQE